MLDYALTLHQIINLDITDLSDGGDGVGRYQDVVVFVPDTLPGDRIVAKITHIKANLAHAEVESIVVRSKHRVRPSCIVADKCGGCQWQAMSYTYQLQSKQNQVVQALHRIGGFSMEQLQEVIRPIIGAPDPLNYRNKAAYPLGMGTDGKIKAGYYQKRSHKIVNINQCPVQDARLDPLLAEVKGDIRKRGWDIYDEKKHRGLLRHFSLRIGRHTGEILLTLITKEWDVPKLDMQAALWMEDHPELVGVLLNRNPDRSNVIFGDETRCIAGRDYLEEEFAGLRFRLLGDTFFQVYTEQAEAMLSMIQRELQLQGTEILLDAYAGIGAFTLPLARKVRQAIAIEVQPQAVNQAQLNAKINHINNVEFHTGTVEEVLPTLSINADIALLDPPRKGCHKDVISHLLSHSPQQIVYVSCNPATLARDLKLLCIENSYRLVRLQPMDFFPQTGHVESVAFLKLH